MHQIPSLVSPMFAIVCLGILILVCVLDLVLKWIPIKPGYCQCGHKRTSHTNGRGCCHVTFDIVTKDKYGDLIFRSENAARCSCQVFIKDWDDNDDDDDDDDNDIKPPNDPGLEELERMFKQ